MRGAHYEGRPRLRLNYHDLQLTAGQVLIALPGMIIDTREVSPDFRAATLLLSEHFTSTLNLGSSYRTLLSIQRQPVATLLDGMEEAMLNFFAMVRGLIGQLLHPNFDRVLHLLFEAWFFSFGPYLHNAESQRVATAAELHTEQFLRLVEQHFRQQHSLDWYATQLNVSPKRLSICVKQTFGPCPEAMDTPLHHWASQVPAPAIEPASEGNRRPFRFPEQFTFRKYFKTHTGMSPSECRRRGNWPA